MSTITSLKSVFACKSNAEKNSYVKSMSEGGPKRPGTLRKSVNELIHAQHSKSLLNVPTIFVDNAETAETDSNLSSGFDTSSTSLDEPSIVDVNPMEVDIDTISMIVRTVEALDMMETRSDSSDSEKLVEVQLPKEETQLSDQKIGNPKKHDFIHELKGSIQEKLHHFSDNIKKHETPKDPQKDIKGHSPTRESGKIFHGLKENVSGKFHQIAEKIHQLHLPHLPHHHKEVQEDGMLGQAMQTILMEKFNIAEASTSSPVEMGQKRKSSSPSLQSIKEKFNSFQRPRRSLEMQSDTSSLKSISEVNSPEQGDVSSDDASEIEDQEVDPLADELSLRELQVHEEPGSLTSNESLITVLSRESVSREDLHSSPDSDSVENFDSILSNHKPLPKTADTNTKPLHASLLSSPRNELLSTSPGVKMHARTESIGCKFSGSPAKNMSSSLGKDQMTTGIHRRSSDSDLSVTPKGENPQSFDLSANYFHSFNRETFFDFLLDFLNFEFPKKNPSIDEQFA